MGPFEIAPGTQFDDSPDFDHGMFPPRSHYPATSSGRCASTRSAATSRSAPR
jgi:hypothetical protein